MSLVAALMTFGFQSTHDKIKELLEYLVRVLDGRSDVEDFHKPFEPPSARYQLTPVSPAVTSLKFQVVKILTEVSNLRANFRLAKLLHIFQAYIKDSKIVNNLKKLHAHVIDDTVTNHSSLKANLFHIKQIFSDWWSHCCVFNLLSGYHLASHGCMIFELNIYAHSI